MEKGQRIAKGEVKMHIYTAHAGGAKLEKIVEHGLGILASPGRTCKGYKQTGIKTAIDNGAFSSFMRGFPFMADVFRAHLKDAFKNGINAEFIVCPDIVAGGTGSLNFSMQWATGELLGARLALAVQDGMKPGSIDAWMLRHFTHIFVGGSVEWKWKTVDQWVEFAHDKGKKVHVGRVGTLDKLLYCHSLGVDSVDSSNFARNDSWDVIEAFKANVQRDMFLAD
jgi:hypothetical protein